MMVNPMAMNPGTIAAGGTPATAGGVAPTGAPPPQPYVQPAMRSAAQAAIAACSL